MVLMYRFRKRNFGFKNLLTDRLINNVLKTFQAGTEDGSVIRFNLHQHGFEFDGFVTRQTSRILSLSWIPKTNFAVAGGIDVLYLVDALKNQVIHRMVPARENKNKETIVWGVTAFRLSLTLLNIKLGYASVKRALIPCNLILFQ
ncbi:DgyrCDS2378 [Dimorphilus gyrociliatus]|uniref:DgyrCDS2378 n=1 Tax=Dimorphilus gyrociliatus TaxID=2664684 RepID=A0A7I8VAA4_9ANNE|nr:DgyrCDS2378 [Dimorphilus gyrociliatus]